MEQTITVSRQGRVATLMFNRPDRLNALNRQVMEEVLDVATELDRDPAIGCSIVTGRGRAFAAGADITQGPEKSVVAYSFTATDPDGNQWWVNAKTGMLDQLRASGGS